MVLKRRAFWSFNRKIRFGNPMHLRTLFGSSLPTRVGIGLSWPLYICDLKEERHWKMVATLDTNAKSKPGPKPDPSLFIQNRIWNHIVGFVM